MKKIWTISVKYSDGNNKYYKILCESIDKAVAYLERMYNVAPSSVTYANSEEVEEA